MARKTGIDPSTLESGVVLGTDSRFSYPSSNRGPNDRGAKLWPLCPGVVAVFAGNVRNAESGLQATVARLRAIQAARALNFGSIAESVESGFRSAIPLDRRRGGNLTACLVGIRAPDGATRILNVSSADNFRAHVVERFDAIGERRAKTFFVHKLRERLPPAGTPPERWPDHVLDMSIEGVGSAASIALYATIRAIGGSVGGPMQLCYITTKGDEKRAVYLGTDESGALRFDRITAGPDEVRTATRPDPRPGR